MSLKDETQRVSAKFQQMFEDMRAGIRRSIEAGEWDEDDLENLLICLQCLRFALAGIERLADNAEYVRETARAGLKIYDRSVLGEPDS